ncbi:acetyltransferase [Cadophora sp. DSE1049]|nr:acetyltransferase [Cadophora sp. DSE1049]
MATFKISGCTVSDGAAIAENSIPAFWQNPNWRLAWPHRTLTYHTSQVAKRIPRNLLNDRDTKRHQKAIDAVSGCVVGYARWSLPLSHARDVEGRPVWPEAVVPGVGEDEEREVRRSAAEVDWDPNQESDVLLGELRSIEGEIEGRGVWMRLDYLAVHPEQQGKGIGTALVESGMREAKKLGLDIFIVAMPSGMGVYERLGFRVERELVQDDSMFGGTGDHRTYFMVFEQKAGASNTGDGGE